METTTPAKKGNGLMIALVLVLALGIGTAIAYKMSKKKGTGSGGNGDIASKPTGDARPKSGWTQAPKSEYKRDNILNIAQSVKEESNRLVATISQGDAKRLFGSEKATKVFLPKPSGIKYTSAPEIVEKLKVKYGSGQLYQKGKTLTEGFDYITDGGEKIFITMKDLFDMAKMNNDTGDIMNSSFYNN